MQRLDGYIRVSQVRGRSGDSFISPDVQKERIEAWAKAHGVEIAEWHTDLDQSGGKMSRPGFDEMLARVDSGLTGGVVVAKLDRFARSLVGALESIKRIQEAGGTFASVAESFDSATPTGRLVMNMMFSLAEFELERVKENWLVSRERAIARGVHIASRTPTGYVRDPETRRLHPHPEWAPVITEVFQRKAAGASWREISNLLEERGVQSPYGSPKWQTRAASHIIENKVYLGYAYHGDLVNKEAHEPLIDRVTWEAAQASKLASVPREGDGALLAGLLRCGGCRYLMKPDKMTIKTGPRKGERVRNYRCRGNHAAGHCENKASVMGSIIEPYVERLYFELAGEMVADGSATAEDYETAERALLNAEAELDAYLDNDALVSVIGAERFNAGAESRMATVEEKKTALLELRPAAHVVATLEEAWENGNNVQRRKLLAGVFDALVVMPNGRANVPVGERLHPILVGELPDNFPGRGNRVPLAPFIPQTPVEVRVALTENTEEGALSETALAVA